MTGSSQALAAACQSLQPGSGASDKAQTARAAGHGLCRAAQDLQSHLGQPLTIVVKIFLETRLCGLVGVAVHL